MNITPADNRVKQIHGAEILKTNFKKVSLLMDLFYSLDDLEAAEVVPILFQALAQLSAQIDALQHGGSEGRWRI